METVFCEDSITDSDDSIGMEIDNDIFTPVKIDCTNHIKIFNSYYELYYYIKNNSIYDNNYYKFILQKNSKEKVTIIMHNIDDIIKVVNSYHMKKLI